MHVRRDVSQRRATKAGCSSRTRSKPYGPSRCTSRPANARSRGRLAKDATIKAPLEPSGWAALYGMLTDRFGVTWVLDVTAAR
jgi:hypothetical protein